jgi:tetratricopeptide (TPR) repeat protein
MSFARKEWQMAVLLVLSSVFLAFAIQSLPVRLPEHARKQEVASNTGAVSAEYLAEARESLSSSAQVRLNNLELALSQAGESEKDTLLKELVRFWDMEMKPLAAAAYLSQRAAQTMDPALWQEVGNRFLSGAMMSGPEDRAWALMEAEIAFKEALKANPDDPELNTNLGIVLVEMGGAPMEGIAKLKEVVEKNPDYLPAILQLGHFSLLSGQISKALYWYSNAQAKYPDRQEINFFIGEVYVAKGDMDSAMVFFDVFRSTLNEPAALAEFDAYLRDVQKHQENH